MWPCTQGPPGARYSAHLQVQAHAQRPEAQVGPGRRMTGEWKTEDGKLCSKIQQRDTDFYCGDARLHGGRVHVQRLDGEVIEYQPK